MVTKGMRLTPLYLCASFERVLASEAAPLLSAGIAVDMAVDIVVVV